MRLFVSTWPLLGLLVLGSCGDRSAKLSAAARTKTQEYLAHGQLLTPEQLDVAETLPNPCDEFKKLIPADWQQGYLETPENPAKPNDRKIKVFYYGKVTPGKRLTVFFNGGPGAASHGSFKTFDRVTAELDPEEKLSFVFIDQRGNGCSDYYPQVVKTGVDSDGEDITNEKEIMQRMLHYGSRGIVSDAEHVRRALIGDKKWNVFGQSFGAFVVHRYLQVAPESVQAAHAHGNTLNTDPYKRRKDRIASQFYVLEKYLERYPEDREIINFLNRELDPERHPDRCYGPDENDQYCNYDILSDFSMFLGFQDAWDEMHSWVNRFVENGQLNAEALSRYVDAYLSGPGNPLNRKNVMDKVVGYVDRNTRTDEVNVCSLIARELAGKHDLYRNGFHECAYIAAYPLSEDDDIEDRSNNVSMKDLPRDLLTPVMFRDILQRNADIPFFWYSGELDPYLPKENFAEQLPLIRNLPNVFYTHFTETGHDGYYTEPLVWQNIIDAQ